MAEIHRAREAGEPASAAGVGVAWKSAVGAGLIAGLVFMLLEMMMVPLFLGGSPWGPPRMIAGIVLGDGVLPPPATFDFGIVLTAMILHFALSVAYAIVLALLIRRRGVGAAVGLGAAFGLALYVINFYGFTAVFPWFANARNWVSVFAHVVFGAVAAWSYRSLVGRTSSAAEAGAGKAPAEGGA